MKDTLYLVIEDRLGFGSTVVANTYRMSIRGLYKTEAEALTRAADLLICSIEDLDPNVRLGSGSFVADKEGNVARLCAEIDGQDCEICARIIPVSFGDLEWLIYSSFFW